MMDLERTLTEQLDQIEGFQKQALQSLRSKGAAVADNYEKFARFNYDVVGDAVDFTVAQARLAATAVDPGDFASKQVDNVSRLAKLVEKRANEYVALLTNAADGASEDIPDTGGKAGNAAAQK